MPFSVASLLDASARLLSEVQQGALPQRGTDIASLHLRSAMATARARSCSLLSLFTDLKAALYSVITGFVSKLAQFSVDVESTLNDLKIPSSLEPLCNALAARPGVLDSLEKKPLLQAVVHVMESNWFQVRGSSRVVSMLSTPSLVTLTLGWLHLDIFRRLRMYRCLRACFVMKTFHAMLRMSGILRSWMVW